MTTKTAKRSRIVPYAPEELKPRDWAKEEAFADAFVKRNRAALNKMIAEAERSFAHNGGTAIDSYEELVAALGKRKQRRRRRK